MEQLLLLFAIFLPFLTTGQHISLPYEKLGWTEEEATMHLLSRFSYGPTLNQVQELSPPLEQWTFDQIHRSYDVLNLERKLESNYPALSLSMEEIGQTYPTIGVRLIYMSRQRGMNGGTSGYRSSMNRFRLGGGASNADSTISNGQNDLFKRIVNAEEITDERYVRFSQLTKMRFGWENFDELFFQLMSQKIERALKNPNQLEEIMVDFWFNHFNVSIHALNDQANMVLSFERDAIRPHAMGNFRDLLGATAKHPAMIRYLDNHNSNADQGRKTLTYRNDELIAQYRQQMGQDEIMKFFAQRPGVNENYARELLELHTLGVDGGYTQQDIEEIARAFTGWKVSPLMYPSPEELTTRIVNRYEDMPNSVLEEGFLFNPSWHDAESKMILGQEFPENGGIEEGEQILDMLASHPSTARFISKKLAIRFVSDEPPASLIDKMANSFMESNGDIKAVLTTMVSAEEFWDKKYQAAKIKTPLEVLISTLRITNAEVTDYRGLISRCTQMGQPLYAYQAPTGYPEISDFWTNGSALLTRMNMANDLANGQLSGVKTDLLALNDNREPGSDSEALKVYLDLLLPGRNTAETYQLLLPVLSDPNFADKVKDKMGDASKNQNPDGMSTFGPHMNHEHGISQVVGLILGSPEYQRQ